MAAALKHRGPDDVGDFYDLENDLGLVHRRLSIIDLSDTGHQPMTTINGRYTIVFNGEIYNYRDLHLQLISEGVVFNGHSDTEVLLRLFEREGVACASKLIGMYAFAVWDREERSLYAVRGPFGIKPLYYWNHEGQFAFASELRALLASDLGPLTLSRPGLLSYLKNGSVQDPDTLVDGVYSLPAGSWLRWKDGSVETSEFWKREFRSERVPDRTQCIQLTRDALLESVERHFVSDVPVGIFLSGGLDSTALVALATKLGKKDIHTFCIAFDDAEYNEGEIARRTAKHFGTVHHEWRLGAEEARSLLDEFLNSIDQPSIDGFNTYCVSRFASRCGMKVVLSGLGGDELFGSYPSFQLIPRMMQWYQRLRFPLLRKLVGNALRLTRPYSNFERMGRFLLSEGKCDAAYEIVRSVYSDEDARKLSDMYLPRSVTNDEMHVCETAVDEPIPEVAENISYLELNRYMLNQLLRDSDVMSMANGLELRVPFLDVMLFKTLAKVSPEIRFTPNKELLLRSVPEIPDWVSNQPKRGFTVPFVHWFGEEWKREFANCHEGRPTLGTKWYHDWSLFVLDQYLVRNLFR